MTIAGVLLWQGWGWLQRGALEEAEEGLRRYRGAVQRRGGEHEAGAAYGIGFLARVLVARGELAEAARWLKDLSTRVPKNCCCERELECRWLAQSRV